MLLLPEFNRPILLESVNDVLAFDHFWAFNAALLDFHLAPIIYLEEYIGPTIELEIKGFRFSVPAAWHLMVHDKETSCVDMIPITNLLGKSFNAYIFSATDQRTRSFTVSAVNMRAVDEKLTYPVLRKGQGLVHPVGVDSPDDTLISCVLSPFDLFQKINTTVTIGDLMAN